jgi:hypothetical protein
LKETGKTWYFETWSNLKRQFHILNRHLKGCHCFERFSGGKNLSKPLYVIDHAEQLCHRRHFTKMIKKSTIGRRKVKISASGTFECTVPTMNFWRGFVCRNTKSQKFADAPIWHN